MECERMVFFNSVLLVLARRGKNHFSLQGMIVFSPTGCCFCYLNSILRRKIMNSFNQITLIGNVGAAPEVLKKTKEGTFVRFSIALNKQYTNPQGQTVKTVHWFQVDANNGVGTLIADRLKKGMRIFVAGELSHSQWTDKHDQKRERIFISAKSVDFLNGLDQKKPLKNETDTEDAGMAGDDALNEE
jgi:single-strand DNA-binding protein